MLGNVFFFFFNYYYKVVPQHVFLVKCHTKQKYLVNPGPSDLGPVVRQHDVELVLFHSLMDTRQEGGLIYCFNRLRF